MSFGNVRGGFRSDLLDLDRWRIVGGTPTMAQAPREWINRTTAASRRNIPGAAWWFWPLVASSPPTFGNVRGGFRSDLLDLDTWRIVGGTPTMAQAPRIMDQSYTSRMAAKHSWVK